jgi:hypothetical protein
MFSALAEPVAHYFNGLLAYKPRTAWEFAKNTTHLRVATRQFAHEVQRLRIVFGQ